MFLYVSVIGFPYNPWFSIAHALCLGLASWLEVEDPILVDSDMISTKMMQPHQLNLSYLHV